MRLTIFLSLLCCSFAFDLCVKENNLLQEPNKIEVNSGGNVVINCTVNGYETHGIQMRKRFKPIVYIDDKGNNISEDYKDRLSCSGNRSYVSVTLKNLTVNDSEIYLCDALTIKDTAICSRGTLLIVRPPGGNIINEEKDNIKEERGQTCENKSVDPSPYVITTLAVLLLCMAVFIYMKLKKSKEKRNCNQNTYVDMTQTIRRNTMGSSFIYNRT
ncbi:uncharacterized protein [Eleutherodactylus coqui]|uniref:uncharacterized protein n=1 Tax=Eleutherodactylus coqui TaxID=57060 RepID=UPI003462FB45